MSTYTESASVLHTHTHTRARAPLRTTQTAAVFVFYMSWIWTDVNKGKRLKSIDVIPTKCNYCTKSQERSSSVCYSLLCEVTWGRKLVDVSQLISHVICLGSKSNSIYFNTETNGGWEGLCLDRGRKRENEDDRYIDYVPPGSIYLAIGAKTSSVRNIVVISLCYPKISLTSDLVLFTTGGKVPGIHLLCPSSCTQVTLTDCLAPTGGGGSCDSFAPHCTQGSPALSVFDDT